MATIAELPMSERPGWPWTADTAPLPPSMPAGSSWPKISIVTPSLNQAQFLEETIRSVLLQGYPNLEYIIIDGGSMDGSLEIIQKYAAWLTYWVSEPDRGQSHAVNKGFKHATGEIMAWINSDDFYLPGAFEHVAEIFSRFDTLWLASRCYLMAQDGQLTLGRGKPLEGVERWHTSCLYAQQGVFWRKALWDSAGGVDDQLQYSFDYDLWLKFAAVQPFAHWTERPLACFRLHPHSKTVTSHKYFVKEDTLIFKRYQQRIHSFPKRITMKFKFRERIADYYLAICTSTETPARKILLGLAHAPWYLFKRKFYYKAKRILFQSGKFQT